MKKSPLIKRTYRIIKEHDKRIKKVAKKLKMSENEWIRSAIISFLTQQ